ncbi:MAG: hypothetical protein HY010_20450 [Acidobacteria bacterium]|nr:hypothetical protein [Acidobacteriota bacterium]
MIIFRVLLLMGLIRLLIETHKPLLCSGIYAAIATGMALISGDGIGALATGGIAFLLSSAYFWLLDRFEESILFWVIMVIGLVIGLV